MPLEHSSYPTAFEAESVGEMCVLETHTCSAFWGHQKLTEVTVQGYMELLPFVKCRECCSYGT